VSAVASVFFFLKKKIKTPVNDLIVFNNPNKRKYPVKNKMKEQQLKKR
jgi:hypothetical protein